MNKQTTDKALRIALQREAQRLSPPDGLRERVMSRIRQQEASRQKRSTIWRWVAIAAVLAAVSFFIFVPRMQMSKDMARYEGSYVEMDGKRIADYALIKSDIREALSIADQAETYAEQ